MCKSWLFIAAISVAVCGLLGSGLTKPEPSIALPATHAEIAGTALETSADVSVEVGLMRGSEHPLTMPHVDSAASIGVVGCTEGADLETNPETAMVELQNRLCGQYGLAPVDAYELMGAVAKVNINQCVPQWWKSMYAGIDRRFLPPPQQPGYPRGQAEGEHAAA